MNIPQEDKQNIDYGINTFQSRNAETYLYNKVEQTTYTFSGFFKNTVSIPPTPFALVLDNSTRVFLIARVPITITKLMCNYTTADSAAKFNVEKLADGQVPGSGTVLLNAANVFDCTATANTTQIKQKNDFVGETAPRNLKIGERLAIIFTVQPTEDELKNLTILAEYQYQL